MILRRLVAHLKDQHWTGVFIELAIVVLGVFLGMQVSNWNEGREQDRRSANFTERLRADLRVESWNYEVQIGYLGQVRANAERIIDALTGKASLSDEALLVAAFRATQFNGNQRRRSTFDELTSAGELGLIRDKALRALAMDIYTQPQIDQIDRHGQESDYRKAFRMALPYQVQQALQASCGDHVLSIGDYSGIAQVLDYPCKTGLAPEVITSSATLLRADPRLVALLQLRIVEIGTDIDNLTTYFAQAMRDPLRRLAKDTP